jgi:hypothetical protein
MMQGLTYKQLLYVQKTATTDHYIPRNRYVCLLLRYVYIYRLLCLQNGKLYTRFVDMSPK